MKLFASSHHTRPSSDGFSLVEVALAVAIAAVGIITCLGLLPEGLEMSRRTSELAITSNILEQVIRDVENAGWPYLVTVQGSKVKKYFNDQGTEVAQDAKDITYFVEIDYSPLAYLSATNPSVDGLQQNLKRLVIRMAATSNPDYKFEGKNPALYKTFNHLVAKDRPQI
ncbi:MAG: Verru_Chthon cassette protein B [Verrucomicrobiaceae bacterium]